MDIRELQRTWHEWGRKDPLWAILSSPEKSNRRWDRDEFFRTGEDHIAAMLRYVGSLGVAGARRKALDFGCGVGRLTQALCRHFDACWGVDISPSMIELAEQYNRHPGRCRYCLNEADDLRAFDDNTFDFIYTCFVLQHMRPKYSKNYIKELLRVLAPGGVLLFQLTGEMAAAGLPRGGPLPPSAFRARITPREPSIRVMPGCQTIIEVTVKNLSDVNWPRLAEDPGGHAIMLGNHWLAEDGRLLVYDDGRAGLPRDLPPAEEADVHLVMTTPPGPGNYLLELDMFQGSVGWFRDRGSETAKLRVRVEEDPLSEGTQPGGRADNSMPRIEMYGVPKDDVLQLIADNGGTVLDVFKDDMNGPEWDSFHYCVTRP